MQVKSEKFQTIDNVFYQYLNEHPELQDRWLFEQTLYTAPARRSIFEYFPFQPNASVLDAGTGFGALALGLAGQIPVTVHGIDYDESKLEVAKELRDELNEVGFFHEDSQVQFHNENLYELSYEEEQFDFVISRFVYQHLSNPEEVSEQIYRVTRPGGYVCLIDIDDQFAISYPETSSALDFLQKAFVELQAKRGGDRYVGRKLSTYLQEAGFEVQATAVQSQAQHGLVESNDLSTQFTLRRLLNAKDDIVSHGIMDEEQFNAYVRQVANEPAKNQFNANAQVVVIAQKPA